MQQQGRFRLNAESGMNFFNSGISCTEDNLPNPAHYLAPRTIGKVSLLKTKCTDNLLNMSALTFGSMYKL